MSTKKLNKLNLDFVSFLDNTTSDYDTRQNKLAVKKTQTRQKMMNDKVNKNTHTIVVMAIIIFALIFLCIFTILQIREKEQGINQAAVGGITNMQQFQTNIVTGPSVSLVLPYSIEGFKKDIQQRIDFDYIDNYQARFFSFLSVDEINDRSYTNGVELLVTEYDNKLSQGEFAQVVLDKLGDKYKFVGDKIIVEGDYITQKIQNKSNNDGMSVYPVVTQYNYYVITVYNQGSGIEEVQEKFDFSKDILDYIRLS